MTAGGAAIWSPKVRALSRCAIAAFCFITLSLVVGRFAEDQTYVRLVIAATAAISLLGLGAWAPRLLLPGIVLWLTALGLTRRLVSEVGVTNRLDPLLMVGPLVFGILVLVAAQRGAFASLTRLSRAVVVLSVLILLGAVNPLEGSLFGGIAGLLFILVPTLGFWIGRTLDDRTMGAVFKLLAFLGVSVAGYGLMQTVAGFPRWDQRWIDQVTFASLNVGGVIRPFSTFSSAAEFAGYLGVAIVIWLGAATRIRMLPLSAAALAVLIPALLFESSRGGIVLVIVALGAMLGAWNRLPLVFAAAVGALLLFALAYGLRSYGPTTFSGSTSGRLISHDVSGLSDPLNPQTSTVGAHWSLVLNGVKSAFSNPVGRGIGTVTIAGSTFGGVASGTEADPSNMAVALGLPGLIAYLSVLVLGIRLIYSTARARRDPIALIGLGIVAVTGLQWLNGGLYSVSFLPWLILGWADRGRQDTR